MSRPDTGDYFNANDLSAIVDILLRESQTNMESKVRIAALSLLEVVLDNKIYREHKFRLQDVEDMVQQAILYDEGDQEGQGHDEYEMECLASLNQFFEVERMKE
jgi:glycerol-3-phosphate cytidylyltransferase-like family protein